MTANKILAVLAATTLLAACGPLVSLGDDGPPPALFTLTLAPGDAPSEAKPAFASIRIEEMEPAPELRGKRIAVTATDVGVSYMTGARWIESPPVLLQRALIDGFTRWGGVTALGSANLEVPADVRLAGRIEQFQLDARGAPVVRVAVQALLLKSRGGGIIGSRRFAVETPAVGKRPDDVARAFAKAQDQLVREAYAWAISLKP